MKFERPRSKTNCSTTKDCECIKAQKVLYPCSVQYSYTCDLGVPPVPYGIGMNDIGIDGIGINGISINGIAAMRAQYHQYQKSSLSLQPPQNLKPKSKVLLLPQSRREWVSPVISFLYEFDFDAGYSMVVDPH